ncbi:MAG: hypothetical protein LUJ09_05840, partial [Firmicutes bacterium]|nr:hypothetical protein [Bacillota bacterium]
CRTDQNLIFYGLTTESITVTREDFLESALKLTYEDLGNNVYHMSWNETYGETYELQVKDTATGNWQTVYTVSYDGERSYTTEHLDRFVRYQYRVIALGGQLQEGSLYAAEPCEISFTTGACALYATIWPLHTLDVYTDTDCTQVIATAEKGTAFCVIGTSGDLFLIRTSSGEGYVDGRYCMINLPDYLGDLCSYDITNSYDSLYMVHDYEIPSVTGTVITGYEYVLTVDGDYLVPLLYPAAQKLVVAAQDAISKGYRLKIYDSYRPRCASSNIYSVASSILYNSIPDSTYTGRIMTDMPILSDGQTLTYYSLMTDSGRYGLGNFLAANGSNHNLGIAMDLTLEKMYSSQEMLMQTSMHDLSWYSEVSQNNANADLLEQIMTNAGFGGLVSEWWHFQDNDAKAELGLEHLWTGVDSECWVKDDTGWRYRQADGSFLKSCTRTIDGTSYTFDASGYVS